MRPTDLEALENDNVEGKDGQIGRGGYPMALGKNGENSALLTRPTSWAMQPYV
jgi:hypothetical protein